MLWRKSDSDLYGDITWFEKQMLAIARAYDSWKISRKMPTLITTELCKKAIVDYVVAYPGHVEAQFGSPSIGEPAFDEAPAKKTSNWKCENKRLLSTYEQKEVSGAKIIHTFYCQPYNNQLKAYIYDDGLKIIYIEIIGE